MCFFAHHFPVMPALLSAFVRNWRKVHAVAGTDGVASNLTGHFALAMVPGAELPKSV